MVVVGAAQPVATSGGTLNVVGGGTTAVPSTQVFSPPQEIILRSSQPTQVITPPATQVITPPATQTVVVGSSTPSRTVFTPPPTTVVTSRVGNLPFTGSNVAFGLIAGIALVCGGGLILLRRREGELAWALDHQASALDRLTRS